MTTPPHPPRKRQGRIHFQKTDNPYPLEMIQQAIPTLEALSRFPALTSWQVCKLLFLEQPNRHGQPRGEVAARRATNHYCLRRLKDLGLVKVKPIARLDNPLAKWEVNYLTERGHQVLETHRADHNLATLPYRPPSALTYQTINPHHMAITDVGVSAMAAASRYGMSVEVWLDDMAIRSQSKRQALDWPMEPDALLVMSHQGMRRALFIEADMGTESIESNRPNSWRTKMANYKTYFAALRRSDPWLKDLPQPDVMTVTISERRLAHLMEATAKVGGRSAYWFAVAEHMEPPYGFMSQVWQRIGLEGYYSPTERFASE